jgi:hypothetical protein
MNIKTPLIFSLILFLFSCNETVILEPEFNDTNPPEFTRLEWIDNPWIDNDPVGIIENNSNHKISLEAGFHLLIQVNDASKIIEGDIFFTVNNDPSIKEVIFSPELIINSTESGIGYVYRVDKIKIDADTWYNVMPGDTYQFYASFTDENDLENTIFWTADIVE